MDLMTYKCPNCGGSIIFDSKNQEFKCESCDSVFTKEQLSEYDDILRNSGQLENTETVEQHNWRENNTEQQLDNINTYICKYCGAEIVTDPTTAASECPYCNNPIIVAPQLTGTYRPDFVIPFKVQKEQAIEALKAFYKKKPFLPNEFKDENRIKEIKGIYIPFWLFDCDVGANITYNAAIIKTWHDSNYEYTKTDRYRVMRKGGLSFCKIPADGSSKMDDAYMDAIEPFDYNDLIDFDAAYLSGYLADKYDVDIAQNTSRINERIENSTLDAFKSTVMRYNRVDVIEKNIGVYNGSAKYVLLPVWILNTKYKDEMYTFAMNGQTGKLVGKLPIDKKKFWGCLVGIAAAIIAVGQFIVF